MEIEQLVKSAYGLVWSLPVILVFLSVGIYFSFKLRFIQIRCLKEAFLYILKSGNQSKAVGDISNFASLCTALSATLGTGNIVGIAVAVSAGGPGTLFWLTLSSFFSLATKFCEGFLSINYRYI